MTIRCQDLGYSLEQRNTFAMPVFSEIISYILGPLGIFCAVVNILLLRKVVVMRQPPADICFFASIFSILKNSVFLSTVIYDSLNPPSSTLPASYSDFCLTTGTLAVVSDLARFSYNLIFCSYYVARIKQPLKGWINQSREVHALCIVLIAVGTAAVFFTNGIGLNMFGYCSFTFKLNSTYLDVALCLGYLFILLLSSWVFLKYLRRVSRAEPKTKLFLRYYFKYMIVVALNYLLQGLCFLSIAILCQGGISSDQLHILAQIANSTDMVIPLLIMMVLLSHPQIKRGLLQLLFKAKEMPQRDSFLIELNEMGRLSPDGYLNSLKEKNRACLLNSILGCITIDRLETMHGERREQQMRSSAVEEDEEELFSWNFTDRMSFPLDEQLVMHYIAIFNRHLPAVAVQFTSFAAFPLHQLLRSTEKCDIVASLSPLHNCDQVLATLVNEGGRSGQFFYFTHDGYFLLKTVTEKEQKVFRDRIQHYYKYLNHTPDSLIVRIYGVYTIQQGNDTICCILMGSLFKRINRKHLIRIYDLKGSTHQREVAKEEPTKTNITFKDVDFAHYQGMVWVKKSDGEKLKKILHLDCKFMRDNGLIDYSLIVIKVNKNSLLEEDPQGLNDVKWYPSTKEQNVVYIFGVIDYLQTWNFKKKSEKLYKSLFTDSKEISAQDPSFYSTRFLNNLVNIIFP